MENNTAIYFQNYPLNDPDFYSSCWSCPVCFSPYYYPIYYPIENKTERAYQIIRVLIQEKVIPEPDSYQKFCDLLEAIRKVI